MTNKRKPSFGDYETLSAFVNLWLKKYELTIEDIMRKYPTGTINGMPWYTFYPLTKNECAKWKDDCYSFVKTNVKRGRYYSRQLFDRQFAWINLMIGPPI